MNDDTIETLADALIAYGGGGYLTRQEVKNELQRDVEDQHIPAKACAQTWGANQALTERIEKWLLARREAVRLSTSGKVS